MGVASDYFGVDRDIGQTNVRFGIATYGEWSTPNEVEFSIYIDVNEDGVDDYRVFNSDARRYDSRYDISDAFAVVVENLRSQSYAQLQPLNGRWPDEIPNAPYNTNVMLLSVRAADLGLDAKNVGFNYYVVAKSQEQRNNVEVTPTLRFVLPSASLDFGSQGMDGPLMRDVHGAQIGVTLRRLNFVRSGIRSVLLLHHHNETGARAEVIDVEYLWPQQVYLPWAPSR